MGDGVADFGGSGMGVELDEVVAEGSADVGSVFGTTNDAGSDGAGEGEGASW